MLCEMNKVSHYYQYRWILYQVNWRLEKGEFWGVTGPNGIGKTTILRLLTGLEKPSSGQIRWGKGTKPSIGVVFPRSYLYDELTVKENLLFFVDLYGVKEREKRINILIESYYLQDVQSELVAHLSKGYQQRVSIARALLHKPELLLLDEPFDGLDHFSRQLLKEKLKDYHLAGNTIVLVSHVQSLLHYLCDRVLLVRDQQLQELNFNGERMRG